MDEEPAAPERTAHPGSSTRDGFWTAVDAAAAVLASPSLERRWSEDSVLPELSTGSLAAHLVRAVSTFATYASSDAPSAGAPAISAAAYFVTLVDDPVDLRSAANEAIRQRSRDDAEPGHAAVLDRWREAISAARRALGDMADDRLMVVAGGLVLTLDDYLRTRIVELVVHTDDLALSLGLAPSEPPPAAAGLAAHTLLEVARMRHGDLSIVRAMSRRQRQPCDVLQVF